jgi:hypothetical protein
LVTIGKCHHIDWDGLQILFHAKKDPPIYECLICKEILTPEEYVELIEIIREKKKDDSLNEWRTPRGEPLSEEDLERIK